MPTPIRDDEVTRSEQLRYFRNEQGVLRSYACGHSGRPGMCADWRRHYAWDQEPPSVSDRPGNGEERTGGSGRGPETLTTRFLNPPKENSENYQGGRNTEREPSGPFQNCAGAGAVVNGLAPSRFGAFASELHQPSQHVKIGEAVAGG
jgi:hypothetical protein